MCRINYRRRLVKTDENQWNSLFSQMTDDWSVLVQPKSSSTCPILLDDQIDFIFASVKIEKNPTFVPIWSNLGQKCKITISPFICFLMFLLTPMIITEAWKTEMNVVFFGCIIWLKLMVCVSFYIKSYFRLPMSLTKGSKMQKGSQRSQSRATGGLVLIYLTSFIDPTSQTLFFLFAHLTIAKDSFPIFFCMQVCFIWMISNVCFS